MSQQVNLNNFFAVAVVKRDTLKVKKEDKDLTKLKKKKGTTNLALKGRDKVVTHNLLLFSSEHFFVI